MKIILYLVISRSLNMIQNVIHSLMLSIVLLISVYKYMHLKLTFQIVLRHFQHIFVKSYHLIPWIFTKHLLSIHR